MSMKEKKWELRKGSAPIKRILLRHIGDCSDHRSDRRDAGADAKQFCGACAAQDLAGHHDLAAGLHLALRSFGHHTVHVDDIRISLAGISCKATGGIDIISCAFSLEIAHRVGVHHGTVDLYRRRVLRQHEAVTLTQHDVGIARRVGECLVELYTYRVGVGHLELLKLLFFALLPHLSQGGVVALACGQRHEILLQLFLLHLQHGFHTFLLRLVGSPLQARAPDISELRRTTGSLYEVGEPHLAA